MNRREMFLKSNAEFAALGISTGLPMEMVDVGLHPDDCTGDTLDVAIEKTLSNILTILDYLIEEKKL